VAAPVNPTANQFIDAAFWDTEIYDRWVDLGTSWATYTTAWTASSNPSIGGGSLSAAFKRWDQGKLIQIRIRMTAGTGTTFGSGLWSFSLPPGLTVPASSPIHAHLLDSSAGDRYMAAGYITQANGVERIVVNGNSGVSATSPYTWATGDTLFLGGTFEIS
jgi:hypothetical protein